MDEQVASSTPFPDTASVPKPTASCTVKQEINDETIDQKDPLDSDDSTVLENTYIHDKLVPERDFILKFEALPVLWDPRHPHYSNRVKRYTALLRLLPILKLMKPEATANDVKKKINSLRSNYRRELRKVLATQKTGNADDVYEPKIWYFRYLDFLRKLEERKKCFHQNIASVPAQLSTQKINNISEVEITYQSTDMPMSADHFLAGNRTGQEMEDSLSMESSQPINISNHIVLEWVEVLDKLDPMQRLFAKKAINDILFEAQLGNLNKHSVTINGSSSGCQYSFSTAVSSPSTSDQ